MIFSLRLKDDDAGRSFAAALSLAPTFADPYAGLATLRLRQGRVEEAVRLQTEAVRYAPENTAYAEQLRTYRALSGQLSTQADPLDQVAAIPAPPPATGPYHDWPQQFAALDWHTIGSRLSRDGCAVIAGMLDAPTCAKLCGLFDDDQRFSKTVVMDRPEFGNGTYRYFRSPIPAVVDELRRAVYPRVARIANEWQQLLGDPDDFPDDWDSFRDRCHHAGQKSPTPILLKYGAGGFNALHRDLRGAVFFPIQMAVVLSPRAEPGDAESEGFQGGAFLFCDYPEGRKSHRREVVLGLGDAVLFCTRDRLVRTGGVYGLQPVRHGAALVTSGTRIVLGVPFHEYR
jgi:hypothetical protein